MAIRCSEIRSIILLRITFQTLKRLSETDIILNQLLDDALKKYGY